MRTSRHPFLFKHGLRMILSDRWHQSIGKKTHKRWTCQQHLVNNVRSLCHVGTAFMESVNSGKRHFLKTICTLSAKHAIPFLHRLEYENNKQVIRQLHEKLRVACLPGHRLERDEVWGFDRYVCSACGSPDHRAAPGQGCPGAPTCDADSPL